MVNSVDLMRKLVDGLLDLAKNGSGSFSVEKESTMCDSLLKDTLQIWICRVSMSVRTLLPIANRTKLLIDSTHQYMNGRIAVYNLTVAS